MRKIIYFLPVFLFGCVANGPLYKAPESVSREKATLIIYRPDLFMGSAGYYEVDINNITRCKLHNNGYLIAEESPGVIEISSSIWNQPGTSRIKINAKPQEVYYVRMEMDSGKQVTGAIAGFAGQLLAEGASSTGGPFVFSLMHPDHAKGQLQTVRLESECR